MSDVITTIEAQPRDLGGFSVVRALPSQQHRNVGPFVFFDHFGPAKFGVGKGIDVRPHPHINLATVTCLYEGELLHRDNLGSVQVIQPGAVNWMTAGKGIAHSERTPPGVRAHESTAHGLQLWVALPKAHEEAEPAFFHHPAATLPVLDEKGVRARVLVGAAHGVSSPVATFAPLVFIDVTMSAGSTFELPSGYDELAAYVIEGSIQCGTERFDARHMAVFRPGTAPTFTSLANARVAVVGGASLDAPRHIWWNFVSSSRERIEEAKRDWRDRKFGSIPEDDHEFIPLPETV